MTGERESARSAERDERRAVAGIAAILFISQTALYIGAPGVEGLFLTRFGAGALPYMYIAVGFAVPITVLATSAGTARLRRRTLYRAVPGALAVLLLLSRVALVFDPYWFYPLLYILMNVASTLTLFYCWGIAGAICDARQAKRLFPWFAAGGILGSSVGGLVTPLLVPLIGAPNLIAVWGLMVAVAAGIAAVMTRSVPERSRRVRMRTRPLETVAQGYREIVSSRLFMAYLAMTALFVALFFLVTFTFSRLSLQEFPDEGSLAAFLGLFQGVATATGLLLSVFVSRRLFGRVGFLGSLLIYGVVFVVGFGITATLPEFLPVVVFRYAQLAVFLGIAGPAYQGVFNVAPSDSRERTRLLVDGVFGQAGMIIAGALLIALNTLPGVRFHLLTGAVLSLGALALALVSRSRYGSAVVSALRSGGAGLFDQGRWLTPDSADARGVRVALEALHDGDVVTRRAAAGVLGSIETTEVTDSLVEALGDPDPEVRRLSVEGLAATGSSQALLEIESLLGDESPRVRRAAATAISRLARYPQGVRRSLEPLVSDPDLGVQARAAAALARADASDGNRLLRLLDSSDAQTMCVALEAYGLVPEAMPVGRIIRLLCHDNARVAAAAAALLASAGRWAEADLGKTLRDEALRDTELAEQILGVYSQLDQISDAAPLEEYSRTCIDRLQQCRDISARLISVAHTPDFDGVSTERTRSALEMILRSDARYAIWARSLAEGAYDHLALEGLSSDDPEIRGYALEAFDSLAGGEGLRPALELIEAGAHDGGHRRVRRGPGDGKDSPRAVVGSLLEIGNSWLTACAITELKDYITAEELDRITESASPVVADAARRAIRGDDDMNRTQSISLVERILFLKETPLFAGLSAGALESVATVCEEHEFLTGEVLDEEGAPGDCMYVIVSGSVRIVRAPDNQEIAHRSPGEAIGEMSLLSHRPRSATMIAAEPLKVLVLSHRAFEQILRKSPEVCLAVMQVLSDRLLEAERRANDRNGYV